MTPSQLSAIRARLDKRYSVGGCFIDAIQDDLRALLDEVERLTSERDEKEADMHTRIRQDYDKTVSDSWRSHCARIEQERDAARVQVERLNAECASAYRRGVEQAVRSVEGDATPSALRQADRLRWMLLAGEECSDLVLEIRCAQAFERGAGKMREAAAQALSTQGNGYYGLTGSGVAKTIRALPIPEDKS